MKKKCIIKLRWIARCVGGKLRKISGQDILRQRNYARCWEGRWWSKSWWEKIHRVCSRNYIYIVSWFLEHMFMYFLWGYGGDKGWANPSSKDIHYWYIPHLRCLPPPKKQKNKRKYPSLSVWHTSPSVLTVLPSAPGRRVLSSLWSSRRHWGPKGYRAQGVEKEIHHLQALNRFWEVRWVANIRWTCVLSFVLDVLRSYGYRF